MFKDDYKNELRSVRMREEFILSTVSKMDNAQSIIKEKHNNNLFKGGHIMKNTGFNYKKYQNYFGIAAIAVVAVLVAALVAALGGKTPVTEKPLISSDVTEGNVSGSDIELKNLLIGTWNDTYGPVIGDFVVNVEFKEDGSCEFHGYENIMYGTYEVAGDKVQITFESGLGEGSTYTLSGEEDMIATYDSSTKLLTVKYVNEQLADIVREFSKKS